MGIPAPSSLDLETDRAVSFDEAHLDRSARARVTDRVVDEVANQEGEVAPRPAHRCHGRCLQGEAELASRAAPSNRSTSSRTSASMHIVRQLASGLQAGEVQQIRDDRETAAGLPARVGPRTAGPPPGRPARLAERLGRGLDRRRGCLEFVRCVRDEVSSDLLDPPRFGDVGDDEQDRSVVARWCGRDGATASAFRCNLPALGSFLPATRSTSPATGRSSWIVAGFLPRRSSTASFAKASRSSGSKSRMPSCIAPRIGLGSRGRRRRTARWLARAVSAVVARASRSRKVEISERLPHDADAHRRREGERCERHPHPEHRESERRARHPTPRRCRGVRRQRAYVHRDSFHDLWWTAGSNSCSAMFIPPGRSRPVHVGATRVHPCSLGFARPDTEMEAGSRDRQGGIGRKFAR